MVTVTKTQKLLLCKYTDSTQIHKFWGMPQQQFSKILMTCPLMFSLLANMLLSIIDTNECKDMYRS
jgi:hypothetical protein